MPLTSNTTLQQAVLVIWSPLLTWPLSFVPSTDAPLPQTIHAFIHASSATHVRPGEDWTSASLLCRAAIGVTTRPAPSASCRIQRAISVRFLWKLSVSAPGHLSESTFVSAHRHFWRFQTSASAQPYLITVYEAKNIRSLRRKQSYWIIETCNLIVITMHYNQHYNNFYSLTSEVKKILTITFVDDTRMRWSVLSSNIIFYKFF